MFGTKSIKGQEECTVDDGTASVRGTGKQVSMCPQNLFHVAGNSSEAGFAVRYKHADRRRGGGEVPQQLQ